MILNQTLAQHTAITQAMSRLCLAFIRHNNPYHEPVNTDLHDMFADLDARNTESDISAIAKLNTSGDLVKVSEELYNPSSDIFDTPGYTAYYPPVETPPDAVSSVEFSGDNNISCAACYLIRHDDDCVAVIKNYHTLTVIDHSQTSWPYPSLTIESINPSPQIYGGRLGSPTTIEYLDVSPSLYAMSYPYEVIYSTKILPTESLDPTPYLYSMSYPTEVAYRTYATVSESLDPTPYLYAMSYPLTVAYITYNIEPEAIDSTGHLYALFLN